MCTITDGSTFKTIGPFCFYSLGVLGWGVGGIEAEAVMMGYIGLTLKMA